MRPGLQEMVALAVVVLVVGALLFRRLRARRAKKKAREASVSADEIPRRRL